MYRKGLLLVGELLFRTTMTEKILSKFYTVKVSTLSAVSSPVFLRSRFVFSAKKFDSFHTCEVCF